MPGTSGVPEITPPPVRLKPDGSAPDWSDHEYGVTPPAAASVAEYEEPSVASGSALVVTTSVAGLTVSVNACVAEPPAFDAVIVSG